MTTLVLVFKKMESEDKTNHDNFYSSSKAEIIINENEIYQVFRSIYTTTIISMQKHLREGSGWIIDSIIDHTISISKYSPLAGSSYIKLPKELNHPRKGLINIQNIDDNKYFKWSIVRYLNPAKSSPSNKTLHLKGIHFPVKIRDIHKIEKEFHRH